MAFCRQRFLAKRLPGVLAALLAGVLAAPAAAHAGCGHRPFLGDGPAELMPPAHPAVPASPCKGPGCSRGPQQAPATPPAPAPRELKPGWAVFAEPLFPDEAGPGGRLYPPPCPAPERHRAAVFHPPRPASALASL